MAQHRPKAEPGGLSFLSCKPVIRRANRAGLRRQADILPGSQREPDHVLFSPLALSLRFHHLCLELLNPVFELMVEPKTGLILGGLRKIPHMTAVLCFVKTDVGRQRAII